MDIQEIPRIKNISKEDFTRLYLKPRRPVIIEDLSKNWVAYNKWTWDYFKELAGEVEVPIYNNTRAGAKILVNGGDGYMKFGAYLDLIQKGPSEWRIFLFNLFKHASILKKDFEWPTHLMGGFLKRFPMLFVGGAGSIAHMHYDIDLAHIFHTQFKGTKRVLLLPRDQSRYIYKMPLTVESAASFVKWNEGINTKDFPAIEKAKGYTSVLTHGDTLFMPTGYWHHMEYLDSGFAMSLRAMPESIAGKLDSIYHLALMRNMNNLIIKLKPEWWYRKKREIAQKNARKLV